MDVTIKSLFREPCAVKAAYPVLTGGLGRRTVRQRALILPTWNVAVSNHRTDYVVTNELAQHSTEATQEACGFRWKIEQLHREGKQVTGLERCQCRKARIQRNHIGCAFLVWVRLKELAAKTGRTMYQLKHGLLDEYLIQQLKNPSLKMVLA